MGNITIIVAVIGAVGAIGASVLAMYTQRSLSQFQQRIEERKQASNFLADQLTNLYLPVSMHLRATRSLSKTHYGADALTTTEVEHALREYNTAIREHLLKWSMYLDPDAPDGVMTDLLEHLLQWEHVYRLKYTHKSIDESIYDGVRRFGYKRFPDDVGDYFHDNATRIHEELHARLQTGA